MGQDALAGLDLEGDARKVPDSPALATVRKLVEEWDSLTRDMQKLASRLAQYSERRGQIERESLPGAMQEAGVTAFTADNGRSVKIEHVVNGGIPAKTTIEKAKGEERSWLEKRRAACLAHIHLKWPGLIKTEVSLSLGKGETQLATEIAELLRKQFDVSPTVEETVNHATLNSHFKELKEQGKLEEIPVEPFALYVGPIAKIK